MDKVKVLQVFHLKEGLKLKFQSKIPLNLLSDSQFVQQLMFEAGMKNYFEKLLIFFLRVHVGRPKKLNFWFGLLFSNVLLKSTSLSYNIISLILIFCFPHLKDHPNGFNFFFFLIDKRRIFMFYKKNIRNKNRNSPKINSTTFYQIQKRLWY